MVLKRHVSHFPEFDQNSGISTVALFFTIWKQIHSFTKLKRKKNAQKFQNSGQLLEFAILTLKALKKAMGIKQLIYIVQQHFPLKQRTIDFKLIVVIVSWQALIYNPVKM